MAWVQVREDQYLLRLTDGYLAESSQDGIDAGAEFAKNLTRLAGRPTWPRARSQPNSDTVQVWVLGGDDNKGSELDDRIRRIAEGETDSRYRIAIVGVDLMNLTRPYGGVWSNWVRHAGMARKKEHAQLSEFQAGGKSILEDLHAAYDHVRTPPTASVEALGLPVIYCGR